MPTAELRAKLLEIERQAESDGGQTVRAMALAAQDDLLKLERAMIEVLSDNENLRRRMQRCESSKLQTWTQIIRRIR